MTSHFWPYNRPVGKYRRKYSDYMKAYIDYFVQKDGSINGHIV
jgi:hypothetical protein